MSDKNVYSYLNIGLKTILNHLYHPYRATWEEFVLAFSNRVPEKASVVICELQS